MQHQDELEGNRIAFRIDEDDVVVDSVHGSSPKVLGNNKGFQLPVGRVDLETLQHVIQNLQDLISIDLELH